MDKTTLTFLRAQLTEEQYDLFSVEPKLTAKAFNPKALPMVSELSRAAERFASGNSLTCAVIVRWLANPKRRNLALSQEVVDNGAKEFTAFLALAVMAASRVSYITSHDVIPEVGMIARHPRYPTTVAAITTERASVPALMNLTQVLKDLNDQAHAPETTQKVFTATVKRLRVALHSQVVTLSHMGFRTLKRDDKIKWGL